MVANEFTHLVKLEVFFICYSFIFVLFVYPFSNCFFFFAFCSLVSDMGDIVDGLSLDEVSNPEVNCNWCMLDANSNNDNVYTYSNSSDRITHELYDLDNDTVNQMILINIFKKH